ncbi:MAG: hypothetical protein ACK6D1_09270 [Planctomycetota bacterium]
MREAFLAFRQQSIWLRTCFNTFDALFQQEHRPKDLLHRTAPLFFDELNHVLLEYCRLQACKLTDPAESRGDESLTVCNLNGHLQREGLYTQAIEGAAAGLMRYRDLVKRARNKVIAHLDKKAVLANQPIGAHSEQDVIDFLDALQTYNDEVSGAVGEVPLDFTGTSGAGDVWDLLKFLRAGLESTAAE